MSITIGSSPGAAVGIGDGVGVGSGWGSRSLSSRYCLKLAIAAWLVLPSLPSILPDRKPHWHSIVCTRTSSLSSASAIGGGVVSVDASQYIFSCVSRSATPVASRPFRRWKYLTAFSVFWPNAPSFSSSERKPSSIRRVCRLATLAADSGVSRSPSESVGNSSSASDSSDDVKSISANAGSAGLPSSKATVRAALIIRRNKFYPPQFS